MQTRAARRICLGNSGRGSGSSMVALAQKRMRPLRPLAKSKAASWFDADGSCRQPYGVLFPFCVLRPSLATMATTTSNTTIRAANARRCLSTTSTADGTRVFFDWLEQSYGARFGGRPLPMDGTTEATIDDGDDVQQHHHQQQQVVTRDSLELEDLERLFQHEISVLKIRGFYPPNVSAAFGRELALEGNDRTKSQNWKVSTSKGLESSDVTTVGRHAPYNIAVANHQTDDYFDEVRNELRDRRGLLSVREEEISHDDPTAETNESETTTHPRLWPLDLLRLELDEVWKAGAGLAREGGGGGKANNERCMGGGLARLMVGPTRWKKGLVHVDELAPLSNSSGCFSANIYLQLPYVNGEDSDSGATIGIEPKEQPVMEVWPLGIRTKWDWYRNAPTLSHLASQDPEGQVVLRKTLGEDRKLTIAVAPGDLVLLCVQRPHCAIGFGHGDKGTGTPTTKLQTRVSLQCFLQYSGDKTRLTIDS